MLLLLAAAAHATSFTETFGGTSVSSGFGVDNDNVGNYFTAEADVVLTGMRLYAKEAESGSASLTAYLWTEPSSGTTWSYTQIGTATLGGGMTGAWYTISLTTTPTLESGKSYIVGVYTPEYVYLAMGRAANAVWGTHGNLCEEFSASSRSWDSPNCPSGEVQYYMELTVEAPDDDGDGRDTLSDCDDTDPTVYEGAEEVWYDGLDNGCDGVVDDGDQDGDGRDAEVAGGADCDDTDASVHPGARDEWYDGVDSDCDGASDYDQDRDGDDTPEGGGGDCDDEDPTRSSLLEEIWYDGVDTDCDEGSDWDQDGDGHDAGSVGGDDCDDTDPTLTTDCDGGGDTDPGGGFGDGDDTGDDDDGEAGCLCMATSGAPIGWGAIAGLLALRRRRADRR